MMENERADIKAVPLNQATEAPLISIQGVSKKFCRSLKSSYAYGLRDIASEISGRPRKSDRLRPGEFWALKDVSFDVYKGGSIGLIGSNGSGKTTLLKIVGGLIKPDTGKLIVRGKVAALIALGAGFNPLLSGRENVYINMSIFGLSKEEINEQFKSVLDFAEIWDAIDAPVRTYSSGMRARLGFACAIHTSPDILLIDEVLAVGDFAFRTKCYRKLAELRQQGVVFVLVSHSSSAILSNCSLAAYLSKGELAAFGEVEKVTQQYEADILGISSDDKTAPSEVTPSLVSQGTMQSTLRIKAVNFVNEQDDIVEELETGEQTSIRISFQADAPVEDVSVNVNIKSLSNLNNTELFLQSWKDTGFISKLEQQDSVITLSFPACGLVPGSYVMKVNLTENGKYFNILDIVQAIKFKVKGTEVSSQCSYYQSRRWDFEQVASTPTVKS